MRMAKEESGDREKRGMKSERRNRRRNDEGGGMMRGGNERESWLLKRDGETCTEKENTSMELKRREKKRERRVEAITRRGISGLVLDFLIGGTG